MDKISGGISWLVRLGIPLLFACNVVIMNAGMHQSKYKGVNLIAYTFIAACLLCLFTEAALSLFEKETLKFQWSIIVVACSTPVIIVLLFMHYRLKKGRNLKKTFHI